MIAVIKYNAGNIRSVLNALERIGYEGTLTEDAEIIREADHVIFPGVGEASSAMAYLKSRGLDDVIKEIRKPFLGICLGMQLMCAHSEEGDTECLGIFPDTVKLFPTGRGYKIPHVGWNTVSDLKGPAFSDVSDGEYAYFVHSYYVPFSEYASAITEYNDIRFSSALWRDNFIGTQFHPEKSGDMGERILRSFLRWSI